MKKLSLLIAMVLMGLCTMAQPPAGPANSGMSFGEKTTADSAVKADDLAAAVAASPGSTVKVKGKVVEVCKSMGCWLKMETTTGTVMIRMKDESFFVPLAVNGKTVVAIGSAAISETGVAALRHYAEDAGKTAAEVAAIKTPKKQVTMDATGILVL